MPENSQEFELGPDGRILAERPGEGLFLAVGGALCLLGVFLLLSLPPVMAPAGNPALLAGLFFFSLFAINCGFPHPGFGHVSFDRIAQFAAVLIVGPWWAAVINGAASFLFPWYRLQRGEPFRRVLGAALGNAGMMILTILAGGWCFAALGGDLPLLSLDRQTMLALVGMALVAHLCNELLMMLLLWARRGGHWKVLQDLFSTTIELFAMVVAVLSALLWQQLDRSAFTLYLFVLMVNMLLLRQLGLLRVRLEDLVGERTRDLEFQTRELTRLTTTDSLTGLFNRRYAERRLRDELRASRSKGRELVLAMADLDHFKRINDEYSHAAGDTVLRMAAGCFQEQLRSHDFVARMGGEEFLFCFVGIDAQTASDICERLRAAVAALDPGEAAPGLQLTISIGVAAYTGGSLDETLKQADRALYEAKRRGRNQVVLFR